MARAVGAGTAKRLDAVLAPTLPYGASGEHQGFPGTLSMGTEALTTVLIELQRSAALWAARTVVVNGHGGNVEAISRAVHRLRHEGHDVGWLACAPASPARPAPVDSHAGRTETSLMLHLRPDVVGPQRPVGATTALPRLLPSLREGGVRAVSPSGVLGDASGASAEEGARMLSEMVDAAVGAVRAWSPDVTGRLR